MSTEATEQFTSTDEARPAWRYYMTETEWQQDCQKRSAEEAEMRAVEARMYAEEEARHRNDPPTLASLKWLRPDLYW